MTFNAKALSSGSTLWETPRDLMDEIISRYGCTIDFACNLRNQRCVLGLGPDLPGAGFNGKITNLENDRLHYSVDSLTTPWNPNGVSTIVGFCNPPYGTRSGRKIGEPWGSEHFGAKAVMETKNGVTTIMLLPARTDNSLFHRIIVPYADEVVLIRGRVKFGAPPGIEESTQPFGSMLAIFRPVKRSGTMPAFIAWLPKCHAVRNERDDVEKALRKMGVYYGQDN